MERGRKGAGEQGGSGEVGRPGMGKDPKSFLPFLCLSVSVVFRDLALPSTCNEEKRNEKA